MSDDYPLGAECDLDALVCNITIPLKVRQAIASTILYIGDLLKIESESLTGIVQQAIEYAEDAMYDPDTPPQCCEDRAANPIPGGATPKLPTH